MPFNTVLLAFLLTLFAGLATGIGSALAFFTKRTNTKLLSISLGFSAGVMIYVSLVEIFQEAKNLLTTSLGEINGTWVTVASFFGGIFLIALIDKLIPSYENPHEIRLVEDIDAKNNKDNNNNKNNNNKLMRMGIFVTIAIAIHNFPEGIATFSAALIDLKIAIPITIAIALHNIPEGIAISIPIYYATGSRKKAFILSLLSGLAEPLGAVIGYFILFSFINNTVLGILFASVAGIMVFISLDELLPSAREFGEHHLSIYGLISGMAIMAISLLLFA